MTKSLAYSIDHHLVRRIRSAKSRSTVRSLRGYAVLSADRRHAVNPGPSSSAMQVPHGQECSYCRCDEEEIAQRPCRQRQHGICSLFRTLTTAFSALLPDGRRWDLADPQSLLNSPRDIPVVSRCYDLTKLAFSAFAEMLTTCVLGICASHLLRAKFDRSVRHHYY